MEDKKEELGRFTAKIRGSWRHVGRPLSQTLLSDDERDSLAEIFYDCGFDPSNIPSEAIIKKGLLRHGGNRLRHRTLELLRSQSGESEEFLNSLLDLVITELEQWGKYDVTTAEEPVIATKKQQPEGEAPTPSLFLRTCIDLDTPKQHANLSLRLKTTRHYPEDGLMFEMNGQTLFCLETAPAGWSTKLIEVSTNTPFDPAKLDLDKNWKFAAENGWTATYKSQDIRLFRPGAEEDLPGFIESQKLARNIEFLLLCNMSCAKSIREWSKESCEQFMELKYSGLPYNWFLFKGSGATKSLQGIDVLELPTLIRIQLDGGIVVGRGNQYLDFAPPRIRIDGGIGNEKLLLNANDLERPINNMWALPKDAPIGRPLNLQIQRGGEILNESRVIELIEPAMRVVPSSSMPKRDSEGNIIAGETVREYVSGAYVASENKTANEPRIQITSLSGTLILVGRIAGQISRWPKEPFPTGWVPVWAIRRISRKKWQSQFCRQEISAELDPIESNQYPIKRRKEWKEALWTMRRRTLPPQLPILNGLWVMYTEAARDI